MGRILRYEENEINQWLTNEVHDPGYHILNDNKVVDEIHDEKVIEENENECSENNQGPSHNTAFECLETAMKWLERQKNVDPIQLTYLRRITDMAALKRMFREWSSENDKNRKKI